MNTNESRIHSPPWIFQTWLSFILSISMTGIGIAYLPVDNWVRGYLGMGLVFSVVSTIVLAKTVRDLHESKQLISRLDEAKIEKILAEYDPLSNEK